MMLLYVGFFLVASAVAQVPSLGKCPKVETVANFSVEKYIGKWYEQARYFAIFELGGKCVTATYGLNDNGTVSVLNKQIDRKGAPKSIQGYAFAKTSDKAKLTVVFPSLPIPVEGSYWVVDTDYTSYALVFSCSEISVAKTKNAWILTRERNPSLAVLEKAYAAADKNKIKKRLFKKTEQANCPADN